MKTGKRMNLSRLLTLVLCFALTGCGWFSGCTWFEGCNSNHISNEKAAADADKKREITVVNHTGLTINRIEINTIEGVLVEYWINPDDISVSTVINDAWKDTESFRVVLIDVYGLHYEETIVVPEVGDPKVELTQENYVKYPGDESRLLDKKANGD